MITSIKSISLYVEDVNLIASFWLDQVGFIKIDESNTDGIHAVEIAPSLDASTHLSIYDKKVIQSFEPELNFGTPSILFDTNDIHTTHDFMKKNGVNVNDVTEMYGMITFNFCDPENNYFAIAQTKNKED